ncbi:hypothetical protein CBL_11752 [Carabus blaptoides fortunei]
MSEARGTTRRDAVSFDKPTDAPLCQRTPQLLTIKRDSVGQQLSPVAIEQPQQSSLSLWKTIQLTPTERTYCDFVVWSKEDYYCEGITLDTRFWSTETFPVTETKKKGRGELILEKGPLLIYSGVPHDKRAAAGIACLIRQELIKLMQNWEPCTDYRTNIKSGTQKSNDNNGTRLIDYCAINDLIITNTFYKHKLINTHTRQGPEVEAKIIDEHNIPEVKKNKENMKEKEEITKYIAELTIVEEIEIDEKWQSVIIKTATEVFPSTLSGSSTCLINPGLLPYVIMAENDKSAEASSTQSRTSQPTTNELELKTSEEQLLSCEESSKDTNDYNCSTIFQTQIIKTISEQVYIEQPSSLPLEQPNLTQLQSELKVTSSNADLSNADVTIMPVKKTDENQLEPPSKKIRSEEPTEELLGKEFNS